MAQVTERDNKVNAEGFFEVSTIGRGYGASLRPGAGNRGGYPVVAYPDGDEKRARIINGPGYVGWAEGWQVLKVVSYVGNPPAMRNRGDTWDATVFTTLEDRQGGGEGHALDRRGRLLVGGGADTLISKDAANLYAVTEAGTFYFYPDGTMGDTLARAWDFRAYESLELHFQQSAAPVNAGTLVCRVLAATSEDFSEPKAPIAGHTLFEVGDFGQGGALDGYLEIGGRSEYQLSASYQRYAVTPPAFGHVALQWGGALGLEWAANQAAQLRVYGRLR